MHRNILTLFICCTLAAFTGCTTSNNNTTNTSQAALSPAAQAPTKAPAGDVVKASAAEVKVSAGESTEATVKLSIADGFHVNANPATYSYLVPTKLEITSENGIKAGEAKYPAPMMVKFEFDPKPLAVYEKEAMIKLPLSVETSAQKGERNVRARLRVQPCNDKECLPPRTIETSIPVTIN